MTGALVRSLLGVLTLFSHEERGASAMVVAIALPGLIGFGALGAETGLWYTIKLQNQSAADAAAISAAYEVIADKTNIARDLVPAASEAAAQNGYTGTTPAVVYPYSDGVVSNGVAVTLQQTQGAFLASPFLPSVTVTSKAVAVVEVLDNLCILALGPSSTDVDIATSTRLDMRNCSIAANSISKTAIELNGSTSSLAAATLVTAGEVSLQGVPINPAAPPSQFTLGSPARIGAPSISDPYAGSLTHTFLTAGPPAMPAKCVSTPRYPNSQICGPLKIKNSIDLLPGTYWITDGDLDLETNGVLKCTSCNPITGAGVTIILTTAKASGGTVGTVNILAANATIDNLNAPHSGTFKGLLIVQDSNGLPPGTTIHSSGGTFWGGPGQTLNGLVYFPNSSLTFHGNPIATGSKCLLLVINSVNVNANSSLDTAGCASAGLTNLPTVSTVALAE
jgi:hypothetical protein